MSTRRKEVFTFTPTLVTLSVYLVNRFGCGTLIFSCGLGTLVAAQGSSSTRDGTWAPALGAWNLSHYPGRSAGESQASGFSLFKVLTMTSIHLSVEFPLSVARLGRPKKTRVERM